MLPCAGGSLLSTSVFVCFIYLLPLPCSVVNSLPSPSSSTGFLPVAPFYLPVFVAFCLFLHFGASSCGSLCSRLCFWSVFEFLFFCGCSLSSFLSHPGGCFFTPLFSGLLSVCFFFEYLILIGPLVEEISRCSLLGRLIVFTALLTLLMFYACAVRVLQLPTVSSKFERFRLLVHSVGAVTSLTGLRQPSPPFALFFRLTCCAAFRLLLFLCGSHDFFLRNAARRVYLFAYSLVISSRAISSVRA